MSGKKRMLDGAQLQARSPYTIKDIGRLESKSSGKWIGHKFTLGRRIAPDAEGASDTVDTVDIRPPHKATEGDW